MKKKKDTEKKGKVAVKKATKTNARKPKRKLTPATIPKLVKVITGKEFTCSTCGYEATKLAKLLHCPLCLLCKGCGKKVRQCCCLEGE